jgi:hypothetical protein
MLQNSKTSQKREIYLTLLVVILALGGICSLIILRHGFSIWERLLDAIWPILSVAVAVGLVLGFVEAKLLRRSWWGEILVNLAHLAIATVLALTLARRPEITDTWFVILVVVIQYSIGSITKVLL